MAKLVAFVQFQAMLSRAAELEDALLPNELEMLRSFSAKYTEPLSPDPFDITALEVILRNVQVRKGYRFDAKKDAPRMIDMPRTKN
ncbi:MAG: hypothetical protein CMM31_01970 [Rhodospirillaceae bacterium]|nr:hypothetical protein [Rhodospirillaceae bacterium]